ncbi:hypothetical protein IscW_ISCW024876, partial [Ixodes scapularis]
LPTGQQPVAAHASFFGEFEYERASECESETSDDLLLYDPLDGSECESFVNGDEVEEPLYEVNLEKLPSEDRSDEVAPSLGTKLAHWAINTNTPASHLTQLLKLLHLHHKDLPIDARTLLKTLRTTEVAQMGSGLYHYFGVAAGLMAEASGGLLPSGCSTLSVSINVDGHPISRSSRKQFWPVLVLVKESRGQNPFV